MTKTKTCSKCGEEKTLSCFWKNSQSADGYGYRCKECKREANRQWMSKNYEHPDPKERKKYMKEYYEENKAKIKEYKKERYEENKEEILKKNRKNYQKNKEQYREQQKRWRENNRKKSNFIKQAYKRRKRSADGDFSYKEWIKLKDKHNYRCVCCNKKEPDIKLEADHIKPLSKGGSNSIENIQPLCKSCNTSKGSKEIKY